MKKLTKAPRRVNPHPVFAFHATSNRPFPAETIRTDAMPQNIRAFAWIAGLSRPVGMGVRP